MEKLITTYYRRVDVASNRLKLIDEWNPLSLKENQYAFDNYGKIDRASTLEEVQKFINSAKVISVYEKVARVEEDFCYYFSAIKCFYANKELIPMIKLVHVGDETELDLIPWQLHLSDFELEYRQQIKNFDLLMKQYENLDLLIKVSYDKA